MSGANKYVYAQPGELLSGSVSMGTYNGMAGSNIAPLIGTISWGDHSSSYWTVNPWISAGTNSYTSSGLSISVPTSPGTYYLIFAFNAEKSSAQVASCTNWRFEEQEGYLRWNDGNDVAGLSSGQISALQSVGRTTVNYQFEFGTQQWTLPGDAIRIVVADPNGYQSPFANSHVRVQSGTGSFASLSPTNKGITVEPGTRLTGSITMQAKNDLGPGTYATLVGVYSWGAHSSSYWTVRSSISSGTLEYTTSGISITVPQAEGTYYILFSFGEESDGAYVASLTNWRYGSPSWNDGNDLADLSGTQISQARSSGRTTVDYLFDTGYQSWVLPADAIEVRVDALTHYDDPLTASYVKIQSGTGSFASVSPSNKRINVEPGAVLSGSVTMSTKNDLAGSDIAPLIGTPSWGAHSTSFWTVNPWISTGTNSYTSSGISLTAPSTAGTYYLIFAFNAEKTGAQVASCTNWRYVERGGSELWNDGNDVAGLSASQIAEAQATGRTTVTYRFQTWTQGWTVPADAIKVVVGTLVVPEPTPSLNYGLVRGAIVDDQGAPLSGVAVIVDHGFGTMTGDDGGFIFQLAEGQHTISMSKSGFVDKEVTISVVNGQTFRLDAVLDHETADPNAGPVPDGEPTPTQDHGLVIGTVFDAKGEPVQGAAVIVDNGYGTITGDSGGFVFQLSGGDYLITMTKSGFTSKQLPSRWRRVRPCASAPSWTASPPVRMMTRAPMRCVSMPRWPLLVWGSSR